MAKVNVYNMSGEAVSEIELSSAVFEITPNVSVMHAVVKAYLANQRQGTQSAKTRSEVSGKAAELRSHRSPAIIVSPLTKRSAHLRCALRCPPSWQTVSSLL